MNTVYILITPGGNILGVYTSLASAEAVRSVVGTECVIEVHHIAEL